MANAIDGDPEIDAQAASRHYRKALELAPNDPALLSDAGLFHVDMGRPEKGLAMLRQAVDLAPDDLDILQALLVALGELERFDEARSELNTARFCHGRDPKFLKLVSDLEFSETRRQHRKSRSATERRERVEPGVLPFLRVISADGETKPAKRFRQDDASTGRPHFGKSAWRSDSPHAQ
jgi:tetratricopeptide (TPR) repeat protein